MALKRDLKNGGFTHFKQKKRKASGYFSWPTDSKILNLELRKKSHINNSFEQSPFSEGNSLIG
jgi:hypothetical protein